jgi:hypothetical protein
VAASLFFGSGDSAGRFGEPSSICNNSPEKCSPDGRAHLGIQALADVHAGTGRWPAVKTIAWCLRALVVARPSAQPLARSADLSGQRGADHKDGLVPGPALNQLVCSGRVPLAAAHRAIPADRIDSERRRYDKKTWYDRRVCDHSVGQHSRFGERKGCERFLQQRLPRGPRRSWGYIRPRARCRFCL